MNTYYDRYSRIGVFAGAIIALILVFLTGCTAGDPINENYYLKYSSTSATGSIYRYDSSNTGGYWHEHNEDGINLSPGSSGSTRVQPNISSLGGWQLNNIGEYVFFDVSIEEDYDGVSSAQLIIYFEVNDDNSLGNPADTVDFQVEFWCKRLGENSNVNHTYNISTVVGTATQHDLFVAVINCIPTPESIVAFRLELTTITSDVDDVIINYVKLRYPTHYPALERN
jgi:hypothetical protein